MAGFAALVLAALAAAGVSGCADLARNIYEGKRTSDTLQQTPAERATRPIGSHEEYERERGKSSY